MLPSILISFDMIEQSDYLDSIGIIASNLTEMWPNTDETLNNPNIPARQLEKHFKFESGGFVVDENYVDEMYAGKFPNKGNSLSETALKVGGYSTYLTGIMKTAQASDPLLDGEIGVGTSGGPRSFSYKFFNTFGNDMKRSMQLLVNDPGPPHREIRIVQVSNPDNTCRFTAQNWAQQINDNYSINGTLLQDWSVGVIPDGEPILLQIRILP